MKKYDSGIKDLSNEIIQNYIINNVNEDTYYSNSLLDKINKLFNNIKNRIIKKEEIDYNNEFLIRKINKSYYNEDYEELLESDTESEDERKFREVIQEQQNTKNNLNMDQSLKQLIYELDVLYDAYDLPDLNITNKEWDKYFYKVYELFIQCNIKDKFHEYMRSVIRLILAKSLVNNNIEINKNDFIEGLDYLKVCPEFNDEVINNLQKELNIKLNNNKITNINEYKRRLIKN